MNVQESVVSTVTETQENSGGISSRQTEYKHELPEPCRVFCEMDEHASL